MAEKAIQGMDQLLRNLSALGSHVTSSRVIVRALRQGAEPIRSRAAELAPRGDDPPHAADTMMITVSDQSAFGAVARIGPSKQGFYLGQQETGNINHSAQPHLRPAFDSQVDEATKIVGRVLGEETEKEARRLGRR